ncbi:MAG TPA: DUF192 domain-containing protein [Methylocella sp.]|nr:DUF192 domain-containing protein [Methylocella sp.]
MLSTSFRGLSRLARLSFWAVVVWLNFSAIPIDSGAWRAVCAEDKLGPRLNLEKLDIVTSSGTHAFSVEVMRSEPERERGLMFRRFLAKDRGMLFDFNAERVVMMWMKNTYLPLDMIFIARTGKVIGVAENAVPLSEKIISSGVPAYAVLEVPAGTVARLGLRIGDSVRHSVFGQ